jgi:PKD repeat protein
MTAPQAAFSVPATAELYDDLKLVNQTPSVDFDPLYFYVTALTSFDGLSDGSYYAADTSIYAEGRTLPGTASAQMSTDMSKWGTSSLKVMQQDWTGFTWSGSRYGRHSGETTTYEFWWNHQYSTYDSQTSPPLLKITGSSGTAFVLAHYRNTYPYQLVVLQPYQENFFNYTPSADGWNHIVAYIYHNTTSGQDNLVVYVNGVALFENAVGTVDGGERGNITLGGGTDNPSNPHACLDYISDFRVTRGIQRYAYSGFTPPTAAFSALGPKSSEDPYYPFVALNLHFDTNPPVDTSWRAQTILNQAVVLDSVTPKFGAGAWSGVGQSVADRERATYTAASYANTWAEYDGCVEMWVKSPATPYQGWLFALSNIGLAAYFRQDPGTGYPTNSIAVLYHSQTIGIFDLLTGYTDVWFHLAFVKQGENFKCYRDGQLLAAMSNPYGVVYNPNDVYVGCSGFTGGTNPNGTRTVASGLIDVELDDFRLTVGQARYTAPFTPPTRANPDGVPTVVTFTWDFGPDILTGFQPKYAYQDTGLKTVKLTATLGTSSNFVTHQVRVYPWQHPPTFPTMTDENIVGDRLVRHGGTPDQLVDDGPSYRMPHEGIKPSYVKIPVNITVTTMLDLATQAWGSEFREPDHGIYVMSNGRSFDSTDLSYNGVYGVVNDGVPVSTFTVSTPTYSGVDTTFTPTFNQAEVTHFWDLGDGTTSTAASPVHTYASNATYTVIHTVTNTTNQLSSATISDVVVTSAPVAALWQFNSTAATMQYAGSYGSFTDVGGEFDATTLPTGGTLPAPNQADINQADFPPGGFSAIGATFRGTVGWDDDGSTRAVEFKLLQPITSYVQCGVFIQAYGPPYDANSPFGGPLSSYLISSNGVAYLYGYGGVQSTIPALVSGDVVGVVNTGYGMTFYVNGVSVGTAGNSNSIGLTPMCGVSTSFS